MGELFQYYDELGKLDHIEVKENAIESNSKKTFSIIARVAAILIVGFGFYFLWDFGYGEYEKKQEYIAKKQFETDLSILSETLASGEEMYNESVGELKFNR